MGGGFGGKESQPALIAATAAVLARKTGRPVKLRLDRDADMLMTGKRHDFLADYDVGFDDSGRILALALMLASRCGYSADLSGPVNDRAIFHVDNAYFLENVETRLASLQDEHRVEHRVPRLRRPAGHDGDRAGDRRRSRARCKLDPLDVRRRNSTAPPTRNVTHVRPDVEDNIIDLHHRPTRSHEPTIASGARKSQHGTPRTRSIKRGIALTPVKFGISFTASRLQPGRRAGARLYRRQRAAESRRHRDGPGPVHQGRAGRRERVRPAACARAHLGDRHEQGAEHFGDRGIVGRRSQRQGGAGGGADHARSGSSSSRASCTALRAEQVRFADGKVQVGAQRMPFAELVQSAYAARVSLSATGFYRTPKIHCDRNTLSGRPFFYFAYGAARVRGCDRHADRRNAVAARRHPARCRHLAESRDRPAARSRAASCRASAG